MLLDGLVSVLATDASADASHQDLRRRQEGQVTLQLGLDDGREGAEVAEDRQEGLEGPVNGVEGIRQSDATHHGAGDIALVPLHTGQTGNHGEVPAQDDEETVDALAGAGIHLVRHRRGPNLARLEPLGDELVAGHQAD